MWEKRQHDSRSVWFFFPPVWSGGIQADEKSPGKGFVPRGHREPVGICPRPSPDFPGLQPGSVCHSQGICTQNKPPLATRASLVSWGDPPSPSWQSLCWRRLAANVEFGFKNTLLGARWENFPEYFQPPTLRPPRPQWEPPEMLQGPEATELGIKTGFEEEKKSQPGIGEMLCGHWKRDAKMKVSRKRRMKSERGKEALRKRLVLEEHPYGNGQAELGDPPSILHPWGSPPRIGMELPIPFQNNPSASPQRGTPGPRKMSGGKGTCVEPGPKIPIFFPIFLPSLALPPARPGGLGQERKGEGRVVGCIRIPPVFSQCIPSPRFLGAFNHRFIYLELSNIVRIGKWRGGGKAL